ncbi:MAG TPA: hypothetical protein VK569_04350, partial [Bacteroidota bacterium]|nr:hypothetical protein [Bacteroidota bacterium]
MTTDSPAISRDGAQRGGLIFLMLAGVLGAVSFWSTALAEITGILLLASGAVLAFPALQRGVPLRGAGGGLIPRLPLLLCALYIASVTGSVISSGAPVYRYAGLLWHPFLLAAALFVPMNRRALGMAGMVFLLSGVVAAPVTLIMNLLRDEPGPLITFTGLTTFADLLALAGAAAFSFLFPF